MKLMINGRQIEEQLPSDVTLAGALQAVQDGHVKDHQVITAVTVDGEPLTAEQLSIWKGRSVDEFDEADIKIKARNAFAAEALRGIAERLQESGPRLEEIVDELQRGRSQEAMESLPGYLNIWNAVQQHLTGVARLMNLQMESMHTFDQSHTQTPQACSVGDQFARMVDQLEQVKSALEAGDLVLLGDILIYEFPERTAAWHNMLHQLADQFDPQE